MKSQTGAKKAAPKAVPVKKATAKAKPKAKVADPLAMCPVDGAGWCPYPFSVAQLKKRLKARQGS
jgi:hypothetical protein